MSSSASRSVNRTASRDAGRSAHSYAKRPIPGSLDRLGCSRIGSENEPAVRGTVNCDSRLEERCAAARPGISSPTAYGTVPRRAVVTDRARRPGSRDHRAHHHRRRRDVGISMHLPDWPELGEIRWAPKHAAHGCNGVTECRFLFAVSGGGIRTQCGCCVACQTIGPHGDQREQAASVWFAGSPGVPSRSASCVACGGSRSTAPMGRERSGTAAPSAGQTS